MVDLLLVEDISKKNHNLLKSLVLLSESKHWVVSEDSGEQLVGDFSLVQVILKWEKPNPVGHDVLDVDGLALVFDDLSQSGDCVVLGVVILLFLLFFALVVCWDGVFNCCLQALLAVV